MKTKRNVFGLVIMIVISFVTQILSLLKSSVVAGIFGTSGAMDAYNLANNIATFVFGFVAAGISTVVIPEYANKHNEKAVDTFITVIYGLVAIVIAVMIAFRIHLVGMFSNRDEMFVNVAADILIILLLSQYLASIANITVAYFQCEGRYNLPKVISLVFQLVVIIALLLFKNIDIKQYAIIVAAGVVFNFLFDTVIALKTGWHYKPVLLFDEEAKQLFKRFLPIVVSTGVYRLSLMIDTTISSFLDAGLLSVLSYATQISSMIDVVVVGNLTIYLYPKITKRIKEFGYQSQFWMNSALFHAITCLISAGFLTVGQDCVKLLFERGAFTADATRMVFLGAAIYVMGQQTGVIRDLIYRYFYACGDTKTPGTNSIIVSVLNITISLLLVKMIGFYGIIIGTVAASAISMTIVFIRFGKKIGFQEKIAKIIGRYMITFGVFVATVVVVGLTKKLLVIENDILSVLIFGVETVVVFMILLWLFNRNTVASAKNL